MAISKLYMLKCGGMVTPDALIQCAPLTTKEYKKIINICMYILEHPTEGLVLIDTGVCKETATDETMKDLANLQPNILKQLPKIGKSAEDVRHVILSHLHFDHFGQSKFFKAATFHVRQKEWEGVHSDDLKGYHQLDRDFADELMADCPKITWDFIPDVPEYDIFGDGSVISIDTKGHTPGHQSFLVRLQSGEEMFLTMDATHCEEELYDENYFIPSTWNIEKTREAVALLRQYRERTGRPLYICHDAAQWYDVKKFPEYYE